MGKHSGRAAFKDKLRELGYELGDNAFQEAFVRFKDLADRKKHIYDADIIALVDDEVGSVGDRIKLVDMEVVSQDRRRPSLRHEARRSTARRSTATLRRHRLGRCDLQRDQAGGRAVSRIWFSTPSTASPAAPTRRRARMCGSSSTGGS